MTDRNDRPLWPFVTAAALGLPLLYVLSVGPIDWLIRSDSLPPALKDALHVYAFPIVWSYHAGPKWWHDLLDAYVALWK